MLCEEKMGGWKQDLVIRGAPYTIWSDKDDNPQKLKKKIDDLQYKVEHGLTGSQQNLSINDLNKIWIEEYKVNNKKGCLQTYQQVYTKMIADKLGKLKISELNHNQVQKLINQLHKTGIL